MNQCSDRSRSSEFDPRVDRNQLLFRLHTNLSTNKRQQQWMHHGNVTHVNLACFQLFKVTKPTMIELLSAKTNRSRMQLNIILTSSQTIRRRTIYVLLFLKNRNEIKFKRKNLKKNSILDEPFSYFFVFFCGMLHYLLVQLEQFVGRGQRTTTPAPTFAL